MSRDAAARLAESGAQLLLGPWPWLMPFIHGYTGTRRRFKLRVV